MTPPQSLFCTPIGKSKPGEKKPGAAFTVNVATALVTEPNAVLATTT